MKLQITAGAAALIAANTHASAPEMAPLSTNGALLVFDFGEDATLEEAVAAIRTMDGYLAQAIADEDDGVEIAQLSLLKAAVVGIERDVVREYAYKTRARDTAEASAPEQESQLQGKQHTDINDSSQSNDAPSEEKEVSENGPTQSEEQQQQRRGRKRSR